MHRLLSLIRRHPRLLAGGAVILLAATALFALRWAGAAHAGPGASRVAAGSAHTSAAPAHASAAPAHAPPSSRAVAASTTTTPRRPTGHGGGRARSGPADAPPHRPRRRPHPRRQPSSGTDQPRRVKQPSSGPRALPSAGRGAAVLP